MKRTNKSGAAAIEIIVALVVALVLAYFIISRIIIGGGGKTVSAVEERFSDLEDYDADLVANFQDRCPCIPWGGKEQEGLAGCPQGTTAEQARQNVKQFREKNCPAITQPAASGVIAEAPAAPETGATLLKAFDGRREIPFGELYRTSSDSITYTFDCSASCVLEITGPDVDAQYTQDHAGTYTLDVSRTGVYRLHLSGEGVDIGIDIETFEPTSS